MAGGTAAPLVVSGSDYPGVIRVVNDLQADIAAVTGVRPEVITADDAAASPGSGPATSAGSATSAGPETA